MSKTSLAPAPASVTTPDRVRSALYRFLSRWIVENPVFAIAFDLFMRSYRLGPLSFEIPPSFATTPFRARWFLGRYEWFERHLIDKHLPSSAAVLEFGGCLGVVSCYTNRKLDHPDRHRVFEANPQLLTILQRNRELNCAAFEVEHAMIGQEGHSTFFISPSILESSKYREDGAGVAVPVKSIQTVLEENPWADTLIMDIEGAEKDVFLDSKADFSRIKLLIIEMHEGIVGSECLQRIWRQLSALGFTRADRSGQVEVWKQSRNEA